MAIRDELVNAFSPELDALADRIDALRAGQTGKRGRGQSGLHLAIRATEHLASRELALRIAYACLRSRGYKDAGGFRKPPSALTIVNELNKLHSGPKTAGAWLLYLAHEAGLIDEFRSPRSRVVASVSPAASTNLAALFRVIEAELQPELALTEPPDKTPRIRQNKLTPKEGAKSSGSAITDHAAKAVQQTPWRINTYMLGVLDKCGLPDVSGKKNELLQIRAERDALFEAHKADPAAEQEYSDAIAAHQYVRSLESELATHAADEQALAAAWARARFPAFYLPVRFDYRGRLYQIDSQLQYTGGSDLSRGLLEFARGKRLGELIDAEREAASIYLKIHIANCWGVRGAHSERIKWVSENFENIVRAEANPHKFDWWRQAKEPYQFLSAAHALVETDVFDNDDAELNVPVSLDATNSGLQHCCLLLRDTELAPLVNLVDAVEPQDFYAEIASVTGLDRETTKRIIVPLIYGAAPSNTASVLAGNDKPFTKEDYARAVDVREAIWRAIPAVRALYERLEQIARQTAKANRALKWQTPSGFEVAQDSRKSRSRPAIDVALPSGRFQAWERYPGEKIDPNKQARSFAANFVHSLDASLLHLIVSSSFAGEHAISDWACAHDSIGVPAWKGFELLSLAGDWMHDMHLPDNLANAWAGWRELGIDLPDPPGIRCDGLPRPISGQNFYLWM